MKTRGVVSPCHNRLHFFLLELLWLFVFLPKCLSLNVNIDYSFSLPDEFGAATLESANCCPHGMIPDNITDGFIPPTVFGIGVQKGGTTSLYSLLIKHPLLRGGGKERHYFDRLNITRDSYRDYLAKWPVNEITRQRRVRKGEDLTEIPILPNGVELFEVSPSYIMVPFAACRIKYFSPNAKFIVLLREPAYRAHSGFNHVYRNIKRLPEEEQPQWVNTPFLQIAQEGVQLIQTDPQCNLLSGHGNITYNDCARCLMLLGRRPDCDYQMFVKETNSELAFSCSPLAKEVLLRGFYAAQLAWWFTLFPPSRFKIYNSESFFKDTNKVLGEMMDFLGYDQQYTESMFTDTPRRFRSTFNDTFALQVEAAKIMLRRFYIRPNLELYRFLHETGHEGFLPFESYLQKLDYMDCKNVDNIMTGLCGGTEAQARNRGESITIAQTKGGNLSGNSNTAPDALAMETQTSNSTSAFFLISVFSALFVLISFYSVRTIRSPRGKPPNAMLNEYKP